MENYRVFSRCCRSWEEFATARKREIKSGLSLEQARDICKEFNDNRNSTQISRGTKYEFESIGR